MTTTTQTTTQTAAITSTAIAPQWENEGEVQEEDHQEEEALPLVPQHNYNLLQQQLTSKPWEKTPLSSKDKGKRLTCL